ncbi:TetR/AcrR family transcriptional regulator [Paenibacillus sp. NEAU-GSW1]|uniref:TetR/AcrR family transcriptional regulator n=1 Tax=Paenibacillus sp. NEAU-GSW1 TaxID=2682486 RepID=UPI0012E0D7B9|nr:TetR/AcrR family transcriptional regulator [Paenibacillus sp. NEAU-GSW1]MUT64791.1 TetR family transcriptional regulator [Paenibacillus sp. NEAU-GSW1]
MNNNRVTDRRIIRTRTMISEAFLVILHNKPFDEISIVDISEQANINRSTFYAHFIDKEDLLHQMVADKLNLLKEKINKGIESPAAAPAFYRPDPIFLALFEHVFEYGYFYRVMFANCTAGDFRTKFNGIIKDGFFLCLSKQGMEQKLQVPLDLLLDYISYSTSGVIDKWLSENKVYSPDHMALQLTRLSLLGIYKSMGVSVNEVN